MAKQKSVPVTVYLPRKVHNLLVEMANDTERSMSEIIAQVVQEEVLLHFDQPCLPDRVTHATLRRRPRAQK